MSEELRKKIAVIILIVLVVGLFGYILYDYNTKFTKLQVNLNSFSEQQEAFNNQLNQQLTTYQQITDIKFTEVANTIDENNQLLTNNINTLATDLNSLDSRLGDVSDSLSGEISSLTTGLVDLGEQTSSQIESLSGNLEALEEDIQNLDQDFSSFITDLYPAIVSVKTNLAQGSGFFVRGDGYIATNHHVIDNAAWVNIVLSNGNTISASVVDSDSSYDLAVLKVDGSGYLELDFEDYSSLQVGQSVVTIGNPFGLSFSLSQGVISAFNRIFSDMPNVDFIQTDTPINPGNSGGPMINIDGKVIGVATAIIAEGNSIGFAIPSNQAEEIINVMIS